MARPVLLITRRVPPAIEARAARSYDVRLNARTTPSHRRRAAGPRRRRRRRAVHPADRFDAALIRALPASVRVIGTYSVGQRTHRPAAGPCARHCGGEHARRGCRWPTAELAFLLILAAARRSRRRRTAGALGKVDRLGADPAPRHPGQRQAARHLRHGPCRPRTRPHGRAPSTMQVHYRDLARLPPEAEAGAIWHDNDASLPRRLRRAVAATRRAARPPANG